MSWNDNYGIMELLWCCLANEEDHLERRWCTRHSVHAKLREQMRKSWCVRELLCDAVSLRTLETCGLNRTRVPSCPHMKSKYHTRCCSPLSSFLFSPVCITADHKHTHTHTRHLRLKCTWSFICFKLIFHLLRVIQKWVSFDRHKP